MKRLNQTMFRAFILNRALFGDDKWKAVAKKLHGNAKLMRRAWAQVEIKAKQDHAGPIQDFLDWLLANADEILALIEKIISLFSGDES